MKKKYLLIVLLFLGQVSQAQLKKFKVEIPQLPKIKLSDSIQSLTLLNRSLSPEYVNYNEDSLQIHFYKKNFITNIILLDSTTSDTTLQVLGDLLFDSQRFDIVIPVSRNIPRDLSFKKIPQPLNWNYVESVCNTYQTDALLVLENMAIRTVCDYDAGKNHKDQDGYRYYYASMDFYSRIHWRIYYPKTKKIIVDLLMNQDTIYWDNSDYELVNTFHGLPSVKAACIETGIKSALNFNKIIAPTWAEDTRYYYITKDNDIDQSVNFAADGKWQEAYDNWLKHVDKGNITLQSKVMLNLALASEMNGNLPEAIEWTKKSMQSYYREVTNHYLKVLLKRQLPLKK